jgi:hypothetical protein
MKTSKVGGHRRFSPEDHLTTVQVKSYFTRLTDSRRQQSQLAVNVIPDNVRNNQQLNNSAPSANMMPDHVANNQRIDDSALSDDDVEQEEMDDDFESALNQSESDQLRLEISNLLGPNSLLDE